MQRSGRPGFLALPLLVLVVAWAPAGEAGRKLDPKNTKIEWIGSKPEGKHEGGFKEFAGSIDKITKGLAGSTIRLDIDTRSLYSDNNRLTNHLKSPDFFGVAANPKATFVTTKIAEEKSKEGNLQISGKLTLRGVTKEISFPAKLTQTASSLELASKFTLSKKEFGMNYGAGKIDDEVVVSVSISLK